MLIIYSRILVHQLTCLPKIRPFRYWSNGGFRILQTQTYTSSKPNWGAPKKMIEGFSGLIHFFIMRRGPENFCIEGPCINEKLTLLEMEESSCTYYKLYGYGLFLWNPCIFGTLKFVDEVWFYSFTLLSNCKKPLFSDVAHRLSLLSRRIWIPWMSRSGGGEKLCWEHNPDMGCPWKWLQL